MTVNATTTVDAALDALVTLLNGDSQLPRLYVGPQMTQGMSWVHISGQYDQSQEPQSSGANNPFDEFFDIPITIYLEQSSPQAPALNAWIAARDKTTGYLLRVKTLIHNNQSLSGAVERAYVSTSKRDIGFDDKAQAYQIRIDFTVRVKARVF